MGRGVGILPRAVLVINWKYKSEAVSFASLVALLPLTPRAGIVAPDLNWSLSPEYKNEVLSKAVK